MHGNPDPAHISTSYVERQNLTMGMSTNGFSKKLDNHIHAIALYFVFYNFCRMHKSLRVSPAMAAGVTDRLWTLKDVVGKLTASRQPPKKRGPYKKSGIRQSNEFATLFRLLRLEF